jgi:streptogramin lyase
VKNGNFVYFDEEATATLGRLNLVTNELTEWGIPGGQPSSLNGVDLDPAALRVWTFGGGQVSALDVAQNRIRVWNVPGTTNGHIKVHNGAAFFGDNVVGLIGKIDPATNRIETWSTPDPGSAIGDLEVLNRPGTTLVEFDEVYGNRVGTLDTSTTGTISVIVPVTSTVTPTRKTIAPTTVQLSSTVTTVTPARSFANGQQTGGFAEWIVPTPDSGPIGMAVLPLIPPLPHANAIAFAERTGNKIGLFF